MNGLICVTRPPVAKAAVVGAIVAFVYSAITWTVFPLWDAAYSSAPPEIDFATALKQLPGDGAYFVPGMDDEKWMELQAAGPSAELEAFEEEYAVRHRAGPTAMVIVKMQGSEPMAPSVFGFGIAIDFLIAFCLAWVMAQVGYTWPQENKKESYLWLRRWRAGVIAVTAGVAAVHVNQWNWFGTPDVVAVTGFMEAWTCWALATLPMAIIQTRCTKDCSRP